MADSFWLSDAQMARIEPFFPLSHGIARVDDRRVLSGIIHVIRTGMRWRDAPASYGPHKTLYNRFVRWSRLGVFDRIFAGLASQAGEPDLLMIDATHLKAHRTAASLFKKGPLPRRIGRTKGGLNSKLHAVCDGQGRLVAMLLSKVRRATTPAPPISSTRCRKPMPSSPIAATIATATATPSRTRASRPASRRAGPARSSTPTTARSTSCATASRTCSDA